MMIKDEMIEKISILAKLELSEKEIEVLKEDLEKMIGYFDKLNELDTKQIEPMSHVFSMQNIFREDVVENEEKKLFKKQDVGMITKEFLILCVPKKMQKTIVIFRNRI